MGFSASFSTAAAFANPESVASFQRHIDPEWVHAALAATGTATLRRRRLPAEQVIWLVLGMGLFRDRPIEDVVSKLDLALPGSKGTVARSSIAQARERLGSEPIKWLFETSAEVWSRRSADSDRWRGLSLYGMDGSSLRLPDTPANRGWFGGKSGRHGSQGGYPLVRVVVLMALRSHLLAGAAFGPYESTYELEYAYPLREKIADRSLTILDRGFQGAPMLLGIERHGTERHWLVRARSNTQMRVLERFAKGDELVEMEVSPQSRTKDPSLPKTWTARLIRYKRPGFPERLLLTSLRDPGQYPAREIAALYHERWELELGYDELKTELLEREETIRSKDPERVAQELWGILLAYNLIRLEMQAVAHEAKVAPTRISFVESLRLIRDEWAWSSVASPGAIPKRLRAMRASIKRYLLPPRRSKRSYPRAVKLKMSNYDRKRPLAELAK